MNTTSLFIIIAYAIVLFYFVKDTEYTKMLGLTFVTAIAICQTKNNVEGYEGSKKCDPVRNIRKSNN